jgi:hypothetical protein
MDKAERPSFMCSGVMGCLGDRDQVAVISKPR